MSGFFQKPTSITSLYFLAVEKLFGMNKIVHDLRFMSVFGKDVVIVKHIAENIFITV